MVKQRKELMAPRYSELKENLEFSYGGPSQRQALVTNQRIKALRQSLY